MPKDNEIRDVVNGAHGVERILSDGGFKTATGLKAVKQAIRNIADISATPLCSGYGTFPDGKKCEGCSDCKGPGKAEEWYS